MIDAYVHLLVGFAYCVLMVLICLTSVRRSSFGYLIIFHEYFYILGLGVFPMLAATGVVNASSLSLGYELTNGAPSIWAYLHVLSYGIGAMLGYFGLRSAAELYGKKLIGIAIRFKLPNSAWFYFSALFSIAATTLYVSLVGIDVALLNIGPVRSGDFSGLVGFEQYSFIKTLGAIGLFSVISFPYLILTGRRLPLVFFLTVVMAISLFVMSAARVTFIDTILLFTLLFLTLGRVGRLLATAYASAMVAFLLFILMFGKEFVGMFSEYLFLGGDITFTPKYDSFLSYFFSQFAQQVYSVDAGIENFMNHGPLISMDVLLSPVGFMPSSLFSVLNLDFLSYQLVDNSRRLSCINAASFTQADDCSVPPYIVGFSAYLMPIAGGVILGFIRFFIFSILETAWIKLQNRPQYLWIVIFCLLFANRILLFIPNTISFAVFALLFVVAFVKFSRFKDENS